MRAFRNLLEAVQEIERELYEMGIKSHAPSYQNKDVSEDDNFDTRELIGYSYSLSGWNWDIIDEMLSFFGDVIKDCGMAYCDKEFQERIDKSHINPGDSWRIRPAVWKQFLNPMGKFDYTYNERLHASNQLDIVINEIKEAPDSRQTILTVYDQYDDITGWRGIRRIPCSMYYQFIARNISGIRTLQMIYTMRSCDFYTHFPLDIILALKLLDYVASMTKSTPIRFIHFIGSLHAFKKDWRGRRIF